LKELELLPVLRIGSALNSGTVTVGFMGSAVHVSNYTVFGREVNIASRLEGVARADSILATEATYAEVKKYAPDLARSFVLRPAATLQGITSPVSVYEVQWREETPTGSPRPASEIARGETGRSSVGI
jgi:class 3 adenylate cyclase